MELTLNKNFYNYICGLLFGGVYETLTAAAIGTAYSKGKGYNDGYGVTIPAPMTDTSGASKDGLYFTSYSSSNLPWNHSFFFFNYNGAGDITFSAGSGSTAATINDTALATPNANITAAVIAGERDTATSIIYTVQFSAASEQTFREIGLQRQITTGNNIRSSVLLGRCVFDEDITLDANTSKTVQVRLAMPTLE